MNEKEVEKGKEQVEFVRIWNGHLIRLNENSNERDWKTLLLGTPMVKTVYDVNINDKIVFCLPNHNLCKLNMITKQQQIEINKVLDKMSNGRDMYWTSVGIKNAMGIISKLENYSPIDGKSILKQMVMNKHIKHIDLMDNEIIFELDWKEMNDLCVVWQAYLQKEFEMNAVFNTTVHFG